MSRNKKWNNPSRISFITEDYLKEAFIKDAESEGYDNLNKYFNTIIIKILGDDNPATRQFREEHPSY